jgi:hypothetical protein
MNYTVQINVPGKDPGVITVEDRVELRALVKIVKKHLPVDTTLTVLRPFKLNRLAKAFFDAEVVLRRSSCKTQCSPKRVSVPQGPIFRFRIIAGDCYATTTDNWRTTDWVKGAQYQTGVVPYAIRDPRSGICELHRFTNNCYIDSDGHPVAYLEVLS